MKVVYRVTALILSSSLLLAGCETETPDADSDLTAPAHTAPAPDADEPDEPDH